MVFEGMAEVVQSKPRRRHRQQHRASAHAHPEVLPRDHRVGVCVDRPTEARLRQLAAAGRLSVSEFVRSVVMEALNRGILDVQARARVAAEVARLETEQAGIAARLAELRGMLAEASEAPQTASVPSGGALSPSNGPAETMGAPEGHGAATGPG